MPALATTFSILFVCTGNICRSPTAERLLRHGLAERLGDRPSPFQVTSAGTGALVGYPIAPFAADLLTQAGVDATGFAARQLSTGLLDGVDLLLAMSREHRAAAVTAAPAMVRRVFTLREFTRLAAAGDEDVPTGLPLVERARALVQAAGRQRGLVHLDDPAADDVPDPYGRSASAYRRSFDLIQSAVEVMCDLLAPVDDRNSH